MTDNMSIEKNNRNIKIAILTPWSISPDAVGGTERFVIDLAESFEKQGSIVDVYMLSGKEYTKNNVNYLSINLFNTNGVIDEYVLKEKFNDFSTFESYETLANNIEKKVEFTKYDLVQINSQLFLKVGEKNKRIFTIHTNPFEYKLDWGEKSFNYMLELMRQESELENTKFVAPSVYYAKEYETLTGVNINFIPHAIDISRIKSYQDKKEIFDELSIDYSKKVILLPSRLEPIQKQPMLFMRAFALLDISIKKQFKVVCTGADNQYLKYRDDLEEFCKENDIDILITRFNNMSSAYKIADVVALPSQSESFGYAALESLSLGIMTIINNIPTFNEVAEGSKNHYFFDKTVDSLYTLLNKYINKKIKIVKQPKKWCDKYSIIKFGLRYLDLYK